MKPTRWLWLTVTAALFAACNKTEEWADPPPGQSATPLHQWMPLAKGAYFVWRGDSIIRNSFFGTIDTIRYWHKMEVVDTFTDGEQRPHYIVHHFYRLDDSLAAWRPGRAETFLVDSAFLLRQGAGRVLLFLVASSHDSLAWDLHAFDAAPSHTATYRKVGATRLRLTHRLEASAIDYYRTQYLLARDSGIIAYYADSLEIELGGDTTDGVQVRERLHRFYVP